MRRLVPILLLLMSTASASCGAGNPGAPAGSTGGRGQGTGGSGGNPGSGGAGTGGASSGSGGLGSGGSGGAASGGSGSGGNGSGGAPAGSGGAGAAGTGTGGNSPATGGSAASGGSSGQGGQAAAPASGGSSGATGGTSGASGIKLGTGGPFPFPQNQKSGMCSLTTAANASQAVQTAYQDWKAAFVSATGAGAADNLRVVRTTDNNDTVSEGIAYGMLAAVYMADRPTFDGLWNYAKSHLDAKGLMHWRISSANAVVGQGSATDADEDIAWALLMASNQWSSATYLADARAQITSMLTHSVAADGMLKPGDNWGPSTVTFPDYFSPAYFRLFAAATNNPRWTGDILDRNYEILARVSGTHGLVPDRTTSTYQNMGDYSYDACRTPWRIGMDYCFNGEPRAQAYLMKIGPFFNGIGAANIGDGYSLTGTLLSPNKNMAFIGPAGVAAMAGFPMLLNDAFNFGAENLGDKQYYPQSLKIMTMLMMSGNFLDYSRR